LEKAACGGVSGSDGRAVFASFEERGSCGDIEVTHPGSAAMAFGATFGENALDAFKWRSAQGSGN
jgi:hypothetical protein